MTGRQRGPRPDLIAALAPLAARFGGQPAIIFAPGPSLPKLWNAERPLPCPAIAINDAWQIAPSADVLYASDAQWWRVHRYVPEFTGAKIGCAECRHVKGVLCLEITGEIGFDPRLGMVRHGHSSGHAAIHLAAQLGANPIALVGFDYRRVDGRLHFFGDHPRSISGRAWREPPNDLWDRCFAELAAELHRRQIEVRNATPASGLRCFSAADLESLWASPEP